MTEGVPHEEYYELDLSDDEDCAFSYDEVDIESHSDDDVDAKPWDQALRSFRGSQPNEPSGSQTSAAPPECITRGAQQAPSEADAVEADRIPGPTGSHSPADPRMAQLYADNCKANETIRQLQAELASLRAVSAKATAGWDRLRSERDHHRMHHRRVCQEKSRLLTDMKRLRDHYAHYEPTIQELRQKYATAIKEKMLMRLDRDRMRARLETLELAPKVPSATTPAWGAQEGRSEKASRPMRKTDAVLPEDERHNPFAVGPGTHRTWARCSGPPTYARRSHHDGCPCLPVLRICRTYVSSP
eukprot:scaffold740_cov405-Prasinococcus_capsulatus_cf.AAC.1